MSITNDTAKWWFKLKYDILLSKVTDERCLSGAILDNYLKGEVTKNINEIREEKRADNFRIGVLARKPGQIELMSFGNFPYTEMHLLYKSQNIEIVGGLERHYMRIYENQKRVSLSGYDQDEVITIDGFYFLYLLV